MAATDVFQSACERDAHELRRCVSLPGPSLSQNAEFSNARHFYRRSTSRCRSLGLDGCSSAATRHHPELEFKFKLQVLKLRACCLSGQVQATYYAQDKWHLCLFEEKMRDLLIKVNPDPDLAWSLDAEPDFIKYNNLHPRVFSPFLSPPGLPPLSPRESPSKAPLSCTSALTPRSAPCDR